jgi:hypothetical protein
MNKGASGGRRVPSAIRSELIAATVAKTSNRFKLNRNRRVMGASWGEWH